MLVNSHNLMADGTQMGDIIVNRLIINIWNFISKLKLSL